MKLIISIIFIVILMPQAIAMERITVNGERITLKSAFTLVGASYDSRGTEWDEDDDIAMEEAERRCENLTSKRPKNCNKDTNISPDGCSSGGIGGVYNTIFHDACNLHDTCYTTRNAAKNACDDNFEIDLKAECLEMNNMTDRRLCLSASTSYVNAVKLAPSSLFFIPAQNDLKCVVWHKAMEKAC